MENQAALTPCVGRCSTVFGDSVCRGCRRFSHEVIDWNRYTTAQRDYIWQRLDQQLDQIVLPLIPLHSDQQFQAFILSRQLRVSPTASAGRLRYEVLRACVRQPTHIRQTGLDILPDQVDACWQTLERRIYALAVASFEFAWLRAADIASSYQESS